MKKGIILGIVGVLVLIGVWIVVSYNKLVSIREEVINAFSNIDVQLERRADLVPNLVNTVKGYVQHEDEAINKVTQAREKLLQADDVEEKSYANEQLSSAIDNIIVIAEAYPDLKASENFINLQDELSGTENRIATARRDYNNTAKEYNKKIKMFPGNLIAEVFDFDDVDYFGVEENKKEVPEVVFD